MRTAPIALMLLCSLVLAACGTSFGGGSDSTEAAPTTARTGCTDGELEMVVQQEIAILNALTTDISRDWFLSADKRKAGIATAQAELGQLETVREALKACAPNASPDQVALIESGLAAIDAVGAFAQKTIAVARTGSITQAQKALRKARPEIEDLTSTLTRALAALSTQWEVWKHDHPAS